MKKQFLMTRRQLLRLGGRTLSALGTASAFGHLGQLSAMAAGGTGYKALVCVFQFGGNDANNMVVPLSTAGYAQYQKVRSGLALPAANLLPIATSKNEAYGLHPNLNALAPLYNTSKKLAVLANVGMLVKPVTRNEYLQNTQPVPKNLFSHSDQQQQWQNASPLPGPNAGTGWSGRMADQVQPLNVPATFPPAIGVAGNALQLIGNTTQPTTITGANFGIDGSDHTTASDARDAALQQMLAFSSGATLVQAANKVLGDAIAVVKQLDQAANSAQDYSSRFPQTGLGQQLAQVARIISVRQLLGLNRQVFFATQGGYDTHSGQLGTQAGLMQELGDAMAMFYTVMGELGLADSVTLFTESEFSRTFQPNGTAGTDHAWAGHQFILGGAAKADVYGKFPSLELGGSDDSGNRGNWIPNYSLDQYGATLAKWFGVPDSNLGAIFPNLANFVEKDLGFMSA